MYNAQDTANKIKTVAKSKGILIKDMLEDCELSKNAISSMLSRGSWLQANNLARIADYLGCSVDYLLGRVNEQKNPESFQTPDKTDKNIVRITSRHGDVTVREMSDEQIDIIKRMVDQMPEVTTTPKFPPLPGTIAAYGGGVKKIGRRKKGTHT